MRNALVISLTALLYLFSASLSAQTKETIENCQEATEAKDVVAACTELLNSDLTNPKARAQVFIFRALGYERLKQWDQALDDYNQSLSLDQDNAQVYFYRGDLQFVRRNYPAARQDLEQAIKTISDDRGKPQDSPAGSADRLAALLLLKGNAYFDLGLLAELEGSADQAQETFNKAVETYSTVINQASVNAAEAYEQRARVYERQYRYKEASTDYDEAANLLEAEAGKQSDADRAKKIREGVSDLQKEAAHSRTMAELDRLFEDYLQGIEKENAYPNWSTPPWTTFRRAHLHETVAPEPATSTLRQPSNEPGPGSNPRRPPQPRLMVLLATMGALIIIAILALLFNERRKTTEEAYIRKRRRDADDFWNQR